MAKTDSGLSDVIRQLSSSQVDGLSLQDLLKPINAASESTSGSGSATRVPSLGETKGLSIGAKDAPTGIQFGSPSNNRTAKSGSSSLSANLLAQAASGGGISSVLGGFGGIAGLGGLVSGLVSLFGGSSKSTPPPLVEFSLPDSQQETVYVSSKGSTTMQGTDVESSTSSAGQNQAGATASSQAAQHQSSQIVQTVKNALLNSSSLNDVIAEI